MIGNDFVIREENCNLSCRYCLTGQSQFRQHHALKQIFQPPRPLSYSRDPDLRRRMDAVIDRTRSHFDLPLLKITGGEVMLIEGICDFLGRCSKRFRTVVLQSNGLLLDDQKIDFLRALGNIVVQMSLDSHHPQGNSYRCNPAQHAKSLNRLQRLLEAGLPVEIYAVLNDRSTPHLPEFADYLKTLAGEAVLLPFPVRGPDRERFFPRSEQLGPLEELLERRADWSRVLPPAAYLRRLLEFVREGGRRGHRCFLPRLVFSSFDDGALTACPNIWFNHLGNALDEDHLRQLGQMEGKPFYQLLLGRRPRLPACRGCFTPWDVLSLYFLGEVSLDELCASPVYRHPSIRRRLRVYKDLISNADPQTVTTGGVPLEGSQVLS